MIGEWYFIPWNIQYLGGGVLALVITFLVFRKNPRAPSYRLFLAFGVSLIVWMLSVFISRSAPSLGIATAAYRIVGFSFLLAPALLLMTILYIASKRKLYYLILVPMLPLSLYTLIAAPFDVSWTNFGWAYSLKQEFIPISMLPLIGYYAAIIVTLVVFSLKQHLSYLRKKYTIILSGFLLYVIVLTTTNVVMWSNPNIAPVGGFMVTIEFLFIAYAVSLRPARIEFTPGKSIDNLGEAWLRFLQKLRDVLPGKELGEDAISYQNYIHSMGIDDVIHFENGRHIFDTARLASLDVNEAMLRTTSFMKKQDRASEVSKEYRDLFTNLYGIMRKDSTEFANDWLNMMLHNHGGFLDKQGVLVAMPRGTKLPPIFKELQSGKVYLFQEEKPAESYQKMKEALEYGFIGLCFTKLEPKKIRATYGVEKASIVWLTFQQIETEDIVNPKDPRRLIDMISTRTINPSRVVVLLDCLDQIIFTNSFDKVRGMLREMKKLCEGNVATFLLSIDGNMFDNEQMAAIEYELGIFEKKYEVL